MLSTAPLQPADPLALPDVPPPANPAAPAPALSPTTAASAPAPITTPDAFLQALIAANFDSRSLARTIPAATFLPLIRSPEVRTALDELIHFFESCATLRSAELRQLALDHLATIIKTKSASPIETRRAATTILRASSRPSQPRQPREPTAPRASLSGAQSPPPIPVPPPVHSSAPVPADACTTTLLPSRPPDRPAPRSAGPAFPTPDAALRPVTFHTAAHVVNSLVTHFAAPREYSCGPSLLGYFLENSATINGAPLPVDDQNESAASRALARSPIADCLGPPFGKIIEPPVELPGATTTHTVIEFAPAGFPGPQRVSLTLTRSRTSRRPACWLVSSITVTPAPAETNTNTASTTPTTITTTNDTS